MSRNTFSVQNICLSDIAQIFSLRQEFLRIFYEIKPSKNKGFKFLCRSTEQHKLLAEMRRAEVSKRDWLARFPLTRTLPFADVYCVVQKSYLVRTQRELSRLLVTTFACWWLLFSSRHFVIWRFGAKSRTSLRHRGCMKPYRPRKI